MPTSVQDLGEVLLNEVCARASHGATFTGATRSENPLSHQTTSTMTLARIIFSFAVLWLGISVACVDTSYPWQNNATAVVYFALPVSLTFVGTISAFGLPRVVAILCCCFLATQTVQRVLPALTGVKFPMVSFSGIPRLVWCTLLLVYLSLAHLLGGRFAPLYSRYGTVVRPLT